MADAVPYNYQKSSAEVFCVRVFSPSEGDSVMLGKLPEQAMHQAIERRYAALVEKQRETERFLLVSLAELEDESDYDEEFLKPSQFASDTMQNVLLQAYRNLSDFSELPKFVTADGDGGIRVQWRNNERELRLICSTTGELKLYWQNGNNYDLEEPSLTNLTKRLKWLKEA